MCAQGCCAGVLHTAGRTSRATRRNCAGLCFATCRVGALAGESSVKKNSQQKKSDITPNPSGHRAQRPCAQGRTYAKQVANCHGHTYVLTITRDTGSLPGPGNGAGAGGGSPGMTSCVCVELGMHSQPASASTMSFDMPGGCNRATLHNAASCSQHALLRCAPGGQGRWWDSECVTRNMCYTLNMWLLFTTRLQHMLGSVGVWMGRPSHWRADKCLAGGVSCRLDNLFSSDLWVRQENNGPGLLALSLRLGCDACG